MFYDAQKRSSGWTASRGNYRQEQRENDLIKGAIFAVLLPSHLTIRLTSSLDNLASSLTMQCLYRNYALFPRVRTFPLPLHQYGTALATALSDEALMTVADE
jgi:hypothetical protein